MKSILTLNGKGISYLGFGLTFLFLGACLFVPDVRDQLSLFMGLFCCAFLGYALCSIGIIQKKDSFPLAFILGMALLARLGFVFFHVPSLSSDIYRYQWEGKVILEGENPYTSSPESENLVHLRDENYHKINFPQLPAIYPPVIESFFALISLGTGKIQGFKLIFSLCDFFLCLILLRFLTLLQKPKEYLLLYAWNPLVILEVSGSGHFDCVGTLLWFLFFLFLTKKRFLLGAFFLAAGTLTKFLPGVCVLFLRGKKQLGLFMILFVSFLLAYAPFTDPGAPLGFSLQEYARHWQFNESFFGLLLWIIRNPDWTRGITLGLFFTLVFLLRYKKRDPKALSLMESSFWMVQAFFCLTPTAHPWYLLWVLPFCVLWPKGHWILLSGLMIFSYDALSTLSADGSYWQEARWPRFLQYIPFYSYWAYGIWQEQKKRLAFV